MSEASNRPRIRHIHTSLGRPLTQEEHDAAVRDIDAAVETSIPLSELLRDDPRFADERALMPPALREHLFGNASDSET